LKSPCGIIKKNPEKKGKEKCKERSVECNIPDPAMVPMGDESTDERSKEG
jgi:hypothetical protein